MKLSDYFKKTPTSSSSTSTELPAPSISGETNSRVLGRRLTKLDSQSQLPREKKTKIQSVFAQRRGESTRLHQNILQASYKQALKSENPELRLFLHHYLQKAANWDVTKAADHDRPTPLIGQKVLSYHREYREEYNTLLSELSAAIRDQATENGMPILHEKEILLIADPSVKETLKCYCDILEPTRLERFQELDGLIEKLIDAARDGEAEPPCFLLVDKLIDPNLPFAERAQAVKDLNRNLMEHLETS